AGIVAAAVVLTAPGRVASQTPVTLPVEVVGADGTTASVTVDVPPVRARDVRSLWMQVHGLSYPDMVSISMNNSPWLSVNNETATVAEPGRSYGGIGGGYSTLKVTLPLPAHVGIGGANTIRFRFNRTDGVASGFRVVAFNLLNADSSGMLESGAFVQDDPAAWTAPLSDASAALAGRELWMSAPLAANSLPDAPRIRAHCADCHTIDGRDLKYFGFSN